MSKSSKSAATDASTELAYFATEARTSAIANSSNASARSFVLKDVRVRLDTVSKHDDTNEPRTDAEEDSLCMSTNFEIF